MRGKSKSNLPITGVQGLVPATTSYVSTFKTLCFLYSFGMTAVLEQTQKTPQAMKAFY